MMRVAVVSLALVLTSTSACVDDPPGSDPETSGSGTSGATSGSGIDDSSGSSDTGGATTCSVVLDEDVTVDRVIEAGCVVEVPTDVWVREAATLTLEHGVRVEMGAGASLTVGDSETAATLVAAGLADDPVLFTSASPSPAPGDWYAVEISNTVAAGTSFANVIFEYGGGNPDDDHPGALHFENPEELAAGLVAVDDCTFRRSASAGVGMDAMASADPVVGLFASFTNNVFEQTTQYAIIARPNVLSTIGVDNTLDQPILVTEGWYEDDAAWPALDVPYVLEGRVTIGDTGAHLQLADVEVLGLEGSEIHVEGGQLTATNVTFASGLQPPLPADWWGFQVGFGGGSLHLSDCRISHVDGTPEPDAVIWFADSAYALASTITGTTFSDNIGPSDIQTQGSMIACSMFEGATPANSFDLFPACL